MKASKAIAAAARLMSVTATDIVSPRRWPRLVRARRFAAHLLRSDGWSTTEIGAALNRDHSTIVVLLQGGKGKVAS